MAKNYCAVFLIIITACLICSCDTTKNGIDVIIVNDNDKLSICSDPANIIRYDKWSVELKALANSINALKATDISTIDDFTKHFDSTLVDTMLMLEISRSTGVLDMVSIYVLSDNTGIVRLIRNDIENKQKELTVFEFTDVEIISSIEKFVSNNFKLS